MLFDYVKLNSRIKEKFSTQINFSKATGIPLDLLSQKLSNHKEFSKKEIINIVEILEINPDEIDLYFFNSKVQVLE